MHRSKGRDPRDPSPKLYLRVRHPGIIDRGHFFVVRARNGRKYGREALSVKKKRKEEEKKKKERKRKATEERRCSMGEQRDEIPGRKWRRAKGSIRVAVVLGNPARRTSRHYTPPDFAVPLLGPVHLLRIPRRSPSGAV